MEYKNHNKQTTLIGDYLGHVLIIMKPLFYK